MWKLWVMLLTLATGVAAVAPPVHAQPRTGTADEAEMAFQLGAQAYLAGKTREALSHFFLSQRLAPNRKVIYNIALCYEQLNEPVAAYRYYQEHVASSATPDAPDLVPTRAALERLAHKIALIEITSDPPGATIYLGRKDLGGFGLTPLTVPVSPGEYAVLLEQDGYRTFDAPPVTVALGQRRTVSAKLTPITGTLVVVGEPEGATVVFRDAPLGVVPFKGLVPVGRQSVTLQKPGWVPVTLPIDVPVDGEQTLRFSLARQVGTLVVSSDEVGALIRLDGVPAGFAPAVLDRVPIGEVRVSVELAGFATWVRKVTLGENERLELSATLSESDQVEAASRFAESSADAPASVTLISKNEIDAFDYATMVDALRAVRGFSVSDDLVYPSVGVRGFSPLGDYAIRMQLQIDGHVINDDWLGSAFLAHDGIVGLEPFDRAEVVRGPGSVLYGTGAVFGVINLVPPKTFRTGGRAGVSMLGPNTGRVWGEQGLALAGGEDGVSLFGGFAYEQPHRFKSESQVGSDDFPDGVAQGVGETQAGSVYARAKLGDVSAVFFWNQRLRQPPNGAYDVLFGDPRSVVFDRRAFGELRYQATSDTFDVSVQLKWDHYNYYADLPYALDDGGLLHERYNGHALGAEARAMWHPSRRFQLTVGVDYAYHLVNDATGEAVDLDDGVYLDEEHPWHGYAAYALAGWQPSDVVALQAGVRFDGRLVTELADADGEVDDRTVGALSPRLSLRLRPAEDTTLKLIGGTAFRAPSIYELTYNDGGETQIPSPDLDPETIYTGELELIQRLDAELELVVGAFVSSLTNYIEVLGEGTEEDPIYLENQAQDVWTAGVEAELRHELSRGIFYSLSYSFTHTRLGDFIDGASLPNAPVHQVMGKLLVPIVRPELSLTNRITLESARLDREGERTPMAVLWDIGLTGSVPAASVQYALTVRNVLGWEAELPLSALVPDARYRIPGPTLTADIWVHW